MGINKESLKSLVGTFQRFLSILRNQDICIYNIQVSVCFSWIVFPIEAVGSMHEIVVYSIPSKHFVPRSIVVANIFILFCCIFIFLQIIPKRTAKVILFSSIYQSLFALFLWCKMPDNGLYTEYIKKFGLSSCHDHMPILCHEFFY